MDADDLIPNRRLEIQLEYLRKHPEVATVGTQFRYFHDPARPDSRFSRRLPLDHEPILADLLVGRLAVVIASLVTRTDLLKSIGGCHPVGMADNDWDLVLRLAEAAPLANVDEVLYLWRVHPRSVCARNTVETQIWIAYACDGARCRACGRREITFEEFVVERQQRPFWQRWQDNLDYYGAGQYRAAVVEVLSAHRLRGGYACAWRQSAHRREP